MAAKPIAEPITEQSFRDSLRATKADGAQPLKDLLARFYVKNDENDEATQAPDNVSDQDKYLFNNTKVLFDQLINLAIAAKERKDSSQFRRVLILMKKLEDCLSKKEGKALTLEDIVNLADFTLRPSKRTKREFLASLASVVPVPESIGTSLRRDSRRKRLEIAKGLIIGSSRSIDEASAHNPASPEAAQPPAAAVPTKNQAKLKEEKGMFVLKENERSKNPTKTALADVIKGLELSLESADNIDADNIEVANKEIMQRELIDKYGGVTDLVISGGGAKYLAQIGVLEELEGKEEGNSLLSQLKAVYGSSVGAVSATALAFGCSAKDTEAQMNAIPLKDIGDKLFDRLRNLFNKTHPEAEQNSSTSTGFLGWLRKKLLSFSVHGGQKLTEHSQKMVHNNFVALMESMDSVENIQEKINAMEKKSQLGNYAKTYLKNIELILHLPRMIKYLSPSLLKSLKHCNLSFQLK
ncbi:MAG: patatin-like phospholipase family protein [Gammaproteobacteria bacterium]|nr:patatin-like phospholipase family protein [Gammaproteobacteria bacterium]